MSAFDDDTRVADGSATLTGRWNIGDKPNGGYLLAVATRALAGAVEHPDPLSVTAHYLRPPSPGPVKLAVEVSRRSRSLSTGTVLLGQEGRPCVQLLGTFGDLAAGSGPRVVSVLPPVMPPPAECAPSQGRLPGGTTISLLDQVDIRLDPVTAGWAVGAPSRRAEMRGWLRFADGQEPDPLALLLFCDALPPTAFNLGLFGWVPTIELTVHVRARPAPGWLRIAVVTRNVDGGYLEEDAELWDSTDRLVAQSRQLARLLPS